MNPPPELRSKVTGRRWVKDEVIKDAYGQSEREMTSDVCLGFGAAGPAEGKNLNVPNPVSVLIPDDASGGADA